MMPSTGLEYYRTRVFFGTTVAGAAVLAPFTVNNFLQGRTLLGVVCTAVVLVFSLNALGIHRRGVPPIPPAGMFVPAIAGIALSVYTQGVPGILWAFPGVVLFNFIFRRRTANLMSAAVVLAIAPFAYTRLGAPLTARAIVTLTLVIVFSNIFWNIIGALQVQLEEQATIDPLTGAFNRRQLAASLESAAARCRRHKVPASLLSLDVDHFKNINDELGHGVGDRVLKEVVTLLRGRVRKLDEVFRMGGEEFLVLLPETDRDGAVLVAEALRTVIASAKLLDDRRVTASFGVAAFAPNDDPDAWLRRADRALYEAKTNGRDRVELAPAE